MPPRVKITKEDIINAALELSRREGFASVNARNVAKELGCSTQPVFSNFESMEKLEAAVLDSAYRLYLSFLKKDAESGNYPVYKAYGMAYTRFAREERELFRLLFMRNRRDDDLGYGEDFYESVDMIMAANGISREEAMLMHLEMWSCVHGIATMLVTSYQSLDEELVSRILSDVYNGIRHSHKSKEERDDIHQNK